MFKDSLTRLLEPLAAFWAILADTRGHLGLTSTRRDRCEGTGVRTRRTYSVRCASPRAHGAGPGGTIVTTPCRASGPGVARDRRRRAHSLVAPRAPHDHRPPLVRGQDGATAEVRLVSAP